MILYSVYDRLSGVYNPPFPAQNDACAVRYFNEVASKSYCGNDYELYKCGEFSQDSGVIVPVSDKPVFITRKLAEKVGD